MTAVDWVDNHCHLDPATAAQAVAEAREHGVVRLVDVGTDVATSRQAIEVAHVHDEVRATAGVHPHEARHGIDGLAALLADDVVVAVGECGLDYHYDHSPRDQQRRAFEAQVALAHDHDLPLVIHTREAWDDTWDVLERLGAPARTVFHCFTGGPTEAERALELGAWLSFSGIVTFPSADEVRDAVAACPLDRLLVETDAPYLTPVPHRGTPNRPALVGLVGEAVAAAKGLAVADVAEVTTATARRLYGLD